MGRNRYTGPKLPGILLDQVKSQPDSRFQQTGAGRKARRKAERLQKKQHGRVQNVRTSLPQRRSDLQSESEDEEREQESTPPPKKTAPVRSTEQVKQPKSILKPSKPAPAPPSPTNDVGEDLTVSRRAAKEGLDDDDAEIAALERKLGIKGKKSKALADDGLDWIAGEGSEGDGDERGVKRKRPEDTRWLRDKRLKASAPEELEDGREDEDAENDDEIENPFSDDEVDGDDFSGFDSEGEDDEWVDKEPVSQKKQRENPYLPPVTSTQATGKYIPPSLRAQPSGEDELLKQLRRQLQGLLNRLAEANLLSIVRSLEDIYAKNARQHVTSTLVDLLISLVADAAVLSDSFLVLHAAFAGAVYKIAAGADFGAQLLERLVEAISGHLEGSESSEGKQALNLLAFLSNLYSFGVVGSPIIFDYVRLLLSELKEKNTELLLRIIRNCGQTLRQDDPSALKDVMLLLQRQVAKVGEENVSVRTKFMIETINDLKNNRMRATNTLATEQTARLKKVLGSLSSARSMKATEPLVVSLADIKDAGKTGKWWRVGASYHDPAKLAGNTTTTTTSKTPSTNEQTSAPASDPGSDAEETAPDLKALARQQGMNTPARRAIFTTLLSSVDATHAHMALLKLHLRNKQQLEIPRVLVHCVRAEESYNPFYALVAEKVCARQRDLRKGVEFSVWDFMRAMEEGQGEGDTPGGPPGGGGEGVRVSVSVREIVNVSKFCATLVAEGVLRVSILTKLSFAPSLARQAGMFVEVFLTTVFTLAKRPVGRKRVKDEEFEKRAKGIFERAAGDAVLIRRLMEVLEGRVGKAELATDKREVRAVQRGCEVALEALEEVVRKGGVVEEESEEEI